MSTSNVFLTFDDSALKDGFGSEAAGRAGAIEVLGFDCEIKQIGSQVGGKPRSVEAVVPGDFTITKAADGRSPLLFRWCCIGEYVKQAKVSCYANVATTPYLVYQMQGVHVAGYHPTSKDGGLPVETITLRYGRLSVIYDGAGLGGADYGVAQTGKVQKDWSWVLDMPL